jgi:D-alanyl-D-alanine carboxypeptidase
MKAIPINIEGIQFRSKLEARWYLFMKNLGWNIEYEPEIEGIIGWIPDFLILGSGTFGTNKVLVEVKPFQTFSDFEGDYASQTIKKIENSLKNTLKQYDAVLLVGSSLNLGKAECGDGHTFVGGKIIRNYNVEEKPNIKFYNEVKSASWNSGDNSFIYAAPYATEAWIKGTLPAGSGVFSIMGAVTDPEFFAADWLLQSLKENDIAINGKAIALRTQKSNSARKKIHTHYSPTLTELVRHTNESSRNMYCEAYVKSIGKKLKNEGSLDAGIAAISEFWRSRGIETSGLYMEDGSGLSARNNVSAKIMTEIMRKIHIDNNTFPNFKKLLAIAVRTGTFKYSGKGTLLEGNLHAKGGSMSRVRSITGYLTTKSQRNIAFTIIVNNFNCSGAMLKIRLENLMLAIAGMDN